MADYSFRRVKKNWMLDRETRLTLCKFPNESNQDLSFIKSRYPFPSNFELDKIDHLFEHIANIFINHEQEQNYSLHNNAFVEWCVEEECCFYGIDDSMAIAIESLIDFPSAAREVRREARLRNAGRLLFDFSGFICLLILWIII